MQRLQLILLPRLVYAGQKQNLDHCYMVGLGGIREPGDYDATQPSKRIVNNTPRADPKPHYKIRTAGPPYYRSANMSRCGKTIPTCGRGGDHGQ